MWLFKSPNKRASVYLVDDDALSIEVLKDYLQKKFADRIDLSSFDSGETCLAQFKGKLPDVVFLDYNLNSKGSGTDNGLRILSEIRDVDPEIEVVMLSGQQNIDVAVEAMKRGARDYIVKGETASFRAEQYLIKYFKAKEQNDKLADYKRGFQLIMILQILIIMLSIGIYFSQESAQRNSMIILGGIAISALIFFVYIRMKSISILN